MLAIQSSSQEQKCIPNLLPARLHHDGPINDAQRYWTPEKDAEGKSQAYFRGRHLHGTSLALPENYTGAILHVTDKQLPVKRDIKEGAEEDGEDEGEKVDVVVAEKLGAFDEVVVWGHGSAVDEKEDAYVRGIREWIGFAEAMHNEDDEEDGKDKKRSE